MSPHGQDGATTCSFSLLYNTGARISEVLQLTPADLQHRAVCLRGKGRKERDVPLWSQTHRQIQKWCRENKINSDQPIFGNRAGKPLSRRSGARRFALILRKAQKGMSRPPQTGPFTAFYPAYDRHALASIRCSLGGHRIVVRPRTGRHHSRLSRSRSYHEKPDSFAPSTYSLASGAKTHLVQHHGVS
jgi:integrase